MNLEACAGALYGHGYLSGKQYDEIIAAITTAMHALSVCEGVLALASQGLADIGTIRMECKKAFAAIDATRK